MLPERKKRSFAQARLSQVNPQAEPRGRLAQELDRTQPEVQHLLRHGWAVVDVLTPEQVEQRKRQIWNDLSSLGTGIEFMDESTMTKQSWPGAPRGLLQTFGAGLWPGVCATANHAEDPMLRLYGAKNTKKPLFRAWDALAIAPPSFSRNFSKRCSEKTVPGISYWLHTDDNPTHSDLLHWIQGGIALEDVDDSVVSTQIIGAPEGYTAQGFVDWFYSVHPDQAPGAKTLGKNPPQWKKLGWCDHTAEQKAWLAKHGVPVKPRLKAGQMILWCGRMPHANICFPAAPDVEVPWRMTVLTNYYPVEVALPGETQKRREMLETGCTSGHQVVCKGALFEKNGSLCYQKFGKAPNMPGGPPKDGFDFKTTPLPVLKGFTRYKRPRAEWSADEQFPDPDKDKELYEIHSKTARLCGGYDVLASAQ